MHCCSPLAMSLKPARSSARETAASWVMTSAQSRPSSSMPMMPRSWPSARRSRFFASLTVLWSSCMRLLSPGCAGSVPRSGPRLVLARIAGHHTDMVKIPPPVYVQVDASPQNSGACDGPMSCRAAGWWSGSAWGRGVAVVVVVQAGGWKGEPAEALEVRGQAGGAVVEPVGQAGHQDARLGKVADQGILTGAGLVGGPGQPGVGVVAHLAQAQGRLGWAVAVAPQAGVGVEAVVAKQPVAVAGDQVDGVDQVVADGVGDEVVEVHPHPAGLDALAAAAHLLTQGVGSLRGDGQQPVAVGAGTRAATPGLDAEQVIQHGDHEVVVQVAVAVADAERDDRQPAGVGVAEQLEVGVA